MHDYLFFNGDSYNKGFTVFEKKWNQENENFAINSAPSFIQFYLVYIYQLYGSAIHS